MFENTFLKNYKRLKTSEKNFPYNLLDEIVGILCQSHNLQKVVVHCN